MATLYGLELDYLGTKTANSTIDQEGIVGGDTSSSAITLSLATTIENTGALMVIQDEGGNAGTNNITINANSGSNINGSGSITINSNYGGKLLYYNGSNWFAQ